MRRFLTVFLAVFMLVSVAAIAPARQPLRRSPKLTHPYSPEVTQAF
jgi:hypothetical protein